MKGVFSAPGDYIYFKSQVPLHKIPVSSVSPLFLMKIMNLFGYSVYFWSLDNGYGSLAPFINWACLDLSFWFIFWLLYSTCRAYLPFWIWYLSFFIINWTQDLTLTGFQFANNLGFVEYVLMFLDWYLFVCNWVPWNNWDDLNFT